MRMSFMPASPMNSAYSDHSHAASVPTETSVSIVAVPWRRFAHAALWNGHAAHRTRVELDPGLLGGVVHGRDDAVELVEPPLDPVGARGARHAGDRQLDPLD